MADVKVRHRETKQEVEMSEYSFELQRHDYELIPPTPGKRPVITEEYKPEPIKEEPAIEEPAEQEIPAEKPKAKAKNKKA